MLRDSSKIVREAKHNIGNFCPKDLLNDIERVGEKPGIKQADIESNTHWSVGDHFIVVGDDGVIKWIKHTDEYYENFTL